MGWLAGLGRPNHPMGVVGKPIGHKKKKKKKKKKKRKIGFALRGGSATPMAKRKKINFGGFGPWGWFGHSKGKTKKNKFGGFGPWEWFDHPQTGRPGGGRTTPVALGGGPATPNGQNRS
jgi:hypothetical protein